MEAERILVIEKDEALAGKEAAALEEAGYEVARAIDVFDGLKKLYEAYPDLIILAMELPVVSGEDAFLQIRQAFYLPIIVLGDREEVTDMLELGADAYLTKPPSLIELVGRVRSLLRRKPRYDPPADNPELNIENHLDSGGDGLFAS
jgi:DNA-binding response OmpR family regulator